MYHRYYMKKYKQLQIEVEIKQDTTRYNKLRVWQYEPVQSVVQSQVRPVLHVPPLLQLGEQIAGGARKTKFD